MSESEQVGVVAEKAPRRAPNKIPEEQDEFLMSLARREVKASEAVESFLDRFSPSTTCDPEEAARRVLFLYRHRLRRARAEKGPQTPVVVPSASVQVDLAPGESVAKGQRAPTAVSADPTTGPLLGKVVSVDGGCVIVKTVGSDGEALSNHPASLTAVSPTAAKIGSPSTPAGPSSVGSAPIHVPTDNDPRVGDRVVVVRGHAALNCTGVVKDLLPFAEHTHSVGVDFGEGVGLWFPPSHLQVLTGGLDGVVARVEAERDAEKAHSATLTAALATAREELERVKHERDEAVAQRDTAWRISNRPPSPRHDDEGRRIALEALRESAAAARAVSDAVQSLASQQADALAAKDAEIASLRLHLDDLRRSGGLR